MNNNTLPHPRLGSAWFCQGWVHLWQHLGWTSPCTTSPQRTRTFKQNNTNIFLEKWIKPTGWFKVLHIYTPNGITYIGFLGHKLHTVHLIEDGINDYKLSYATLRGIVFTMK